MKEIILNAYRFNLEYARSLVGDLDEKMMTQSFKPGLENHPAWTLGHLVSGATLTSKYLGGPYEISESWELLFRRTGPGDPTKPDLDLQKYPSKKELLSELSKQHYIVENLIVEIDSDRFAEDAKWRYSKYMPSLGDLLYFMCVTHESMHLGQLAAWRRAMKLDSALAKL
jgi:hypothetical protein